MRHHSMLVHLLVVVIYLFGIVLESTGRQAMARNNIVDNSITVAETEETDHARSQYSLCSRIRYSNLRSL